MLLLLLPTAGGDRISKNANITDKMAVECNNFGSTADTRCASSDYWRSFVLLYVCFYYVISTSVYLAIVFFVCFVYDAYNALTICVILCWTEGNTQNAGPPADELQKLIELGEAPAAVTAGAHSADPPLRCRPSDRLYYYNSLPFHMSFLGQLNTIVPQTTSR
jgi:hypothetical protein